MTPAKSYERIPQTFAFREFVYGQPARGFAVGVARPPALRAVPVVPRPSIQGWLPERAAA